MIREMSNCVSQGGPFRVLYFPRTFSSGPDIGIPIFPDIEITPEVRMLAHVRARAYEQGHMLEETFIFKEKQQEVPRKERFNNWIKRTALLLKEQERKKE